jgi:BMFP domain-containing protein YqiC
MERIRPPLLDEIQQRIGELMRSSPAADLERNLKALVAQAFDRFDLVTREELDAHRAVVEALETRIAELERAVAARD